MSNNSQKLNLRMIGIKIKDLTARKMEGASTIAYA